MELDNLVTLDEHEDGARLHLRDKHGVEVDAYVVIKGPDSSAYRIARRKQRKQVVALVEKGIDIDSYDFFPLDVEFVCQVVSGWGEITQGGEEYEYNADNAKSLFSKAPPIVELILDFCGNRENFTKG